MECSTRDPQQLWPLKLSLVVGVGMLGLKLYAYAVSNSSAVFSDAAESVVHNAAVAFALFSLWYAARPADRQHQYGHEKIAFFSAGFEGSLIAGAALFILYASVRAWVTGAPLGNLGQGTWLTALAFAVNGLLGGFLVWRGRRGGSLIIEANGQHVLSDCWTSLGVVAGLLLTQWTGWRWCDPVCAILVALSILWTGGRLAWRSFGGLMDEADPAVDQLLRSVLDEQAALHGIQYHDLRHRRTGGQVLAEVHLLFPDETPLWLAHAQATDIEDELERKLGAGARVLTHLEPAKDHDRLHGAAGPAGAER